MKTCVETVHGIPSLCTLDSLFKPLRERTPSCLVGKQLNHVRM